MDIYKLTRLMIMKRIEKYGRRMALAAMATAMAANAAAESDATVIDRVGVYDRTVFYDGYKTDAVVDADVDDGIVRFTNYHYTRPIDRQAIADLPGDLELMVDIGALCDNYDRMGRVMLAFPPKGSATYDPDAADRIEIARFITPFMNKNKTPDVVPYLYEINDLRTVLADDALYADRDLWLEVELFGIPYAANQQVAGCEGRNDVFTATVAFNGNRHDDALTETQARRRAAAEGAATVVPINVARCEIHGNVNLNNYKEVATDTLGTTTRTYSFHTDRDLSDAQITLILTNHGAGENGEEYVRRQHLIYVDGELSLVYTPGGISCEPYRKYNTQTNGIYTTMPRPIAFWRNFSNWCPGQAVPIRRIPLGELQAGDHELMIRVPDAEFYGSDGDFRPSAWLLGVESGTLLPSGVEELAAADPGILTLQGETLCIADCESVAELRIYSLDGQLLRGYYRPGERIALSDMPAGGKIAVATLTDNRISMLKIMR